MHGFLRLHQSRQGLSRPAGGKRGARKSREQGHDRAAWPRPVLGGSSIVIAALFVATGGVYFGRDDVDPWDITRDARKYAGPWPVVAHPPCERWGRYANGGPAARVPRFQGDDDGCFAAALSAVREFGGVLEHPEASSAWMRYSLLAPPRSGGWVRADWHGWTCCVSQGNYGHRANKATWLYAVGCVLPSLTWGKAPVSEERATELANSPNRRRAIKTGICQRMSHKQRKATPPAFAELLISIAKSARKESP
jgi:hypothetical protein